MASEHNFNPDPPPTNTPAPKILANEPHPSGHMLVTYALPGLRRATVRVPFASWEAGDHAPVGGALAEIVAKLDSQRRRLSDNVASPD